MAGDTVTFLFSDIEASTRRWEADPVAMSAALARHDGVMRQAVESAGGEIFKHTGDGMCAVFVAAADGVTAAVAAQRGLRAEDWGEVGPLRVRMAVHSGTAERRAGDYFGSTLCRVARLMSTAHGGQVVASRATVELSRDSLPAGATLVDLGDHRLKDLAEAERVFQVAHPELQHDFPPLRSLASHRHQLPESPTPLVGRERELEEVAGLLAGARLVTVVGAGGAGKTRLALESARRAVGSFPDGVFLVELAPLTDPQLVAQAVVSALGLVLDGLGSGPGAVIEGLVERLAARRVLIVLDSCEHLVEPAAALAGTLLRRCPDVTVLATSREPLGVDGEALWRIPSLSVPPEGAADPGAAAATDAVVLLCQRARTADPSFRLTAANVEAVAQICRRLDGMPLALELAAARFRMLSPGEVAARLDDGFRLLTGGARFLHRHRTLRATFDWGYELLSPAEQTMLGRLSVFAGGFDLEAAEAVVPDGTEIVLDDVLPLLALLVDRSWVALDRGEEHTRYRLLETIRQYAAEKLGPAGDGDDVRRRHTRHFVEFGTFLRDRLYPPRSFMTRAELDRDNLRAALERSFAGGDIEACLCVTAGLSRYWGLSGRFVEGRTWLERVLAAAPAEPSPDVVAALIGLAFVLWLSGDPSDRAVALCERARAIARATGDAAGEAMATSRLGHLALRQGELDEAGRLMGEAAEHFRAVGTVVGAARSEWDLGCVASARGDVESAAARFERVLALAGGDVDNDLLVGQALGSLGPLMAALGDREKAARLAAQGIEVARRIGVDRILVMALARGVETTLRMGEASQAVRFLDEALRLLPAREGLGWVAYSLELSVLIAGTGDRPTVAARLLGAARAVDEATGEPPEARSLRDGVQRCLGDLQRALGPERLAAELDAGGRLPVRESIALALEALATDSRSSL